MSGHGEIGSRKLLKEEFVSGLTGSSKLEILALSTIVPGVAVIRHWSAYYSGRWSSKQKDDDQAFCRSRRFLISIFLDSMSVIMPVLCFITVLADWVYVNTTFSVILFIWVLAKRFGSTATTHTEGSNLSSLRTSILSYRVSMMTVTCLCILAVDFKIFPRRYAKAETYGIGLMDLGVGSFVLANALVSKQARCSKMGGWRTTLKSVTPLLILGFGRLIFTRGVDYQVHVGEYGVHWNFFFTLAAVSILTSLTKLHPKYCGLLGLSILGVYQVLLMSGLNEYLLSNERALDIISLNKEGIFSVFGYWGMYLVGVYLGHSLLFQNNVTKVGLARARICCLSIFFWLLTFILDKYLERVSRRMCNLSYVVLVLAQNFQVLSIMTMSDLVPGKKPSLLEEAIDQNLLAVFLLANLLTGAVNLGMDTLSSSAVAAFGILSGYSMLLVGFVGLARFHGIRLKFW
ncbi:transferases, transferring acyl groups [Wolffia australiana]